MHWSHRFIKWLLIFQILKISSNWWHFSTLFIQWDKRNWIYMEMCIHLCIFKEMTHWLSYLHLECCLLNWHYKLPMLKKKHILKELRYLSLLSDIMNLYFIGYLISILWRKIYFTLGNTKAPFLLFLYIDQDLAWE